MTVTKPARQRLFFALWPDPATRIALAQRQAPLSGRKTHPLDLHMTLAFLGNQPDHHLPLLQAILTRIPAIDLLLTLNKSGYFKRSRVAWVAMQVAPPELSLLHDWLLQELEACAIGFGPSPVFLPHLTLARDADPPGDLLFPPIAWHADQLVLAQSSTTSQGTRYQLLDSVRLASTPAKGNV